LGWGFNGSSLEAKLEVGRDLVLDGVFVAAAFFFAAPPPFSSAVVLAAPFAVFFAWANRTGGISESTTTRHNTRKSVFVICDLRHFLTGPDQSTTENRVIGPESRHSATKNYTHWPPQKCPKGLNPHRIL
ncbi:MAG: hypothetical protein NTZ98_20225, partial [Acidobacteria bacterium]|nr:hypothetical protein [Acidobacteriota bacterium]